MEFILVFFPLIFTYVIISEVWIMSRISSKQTARFEAKLTEIAAQSVKVSNPLLAKLAAKRDTYLANLR